MALINLRVSDEARTAIRKLAQDSGLTVSEYLRSRARVTPAWLARTAGITVTEAKHRLERL